MKLILKIIPLIIFTISCNGNEPLTEPKPQSVIFIDLTTINIDSVNNHSAENIDMVVRSGVVFASNFKNINNYLLMNDSLNFSAELKSLFPEKKFINNVLPFKEAAEVFTKNKPIILLSKLKDSSATVLQADSSFKQLLDAVNYSAEYNKTILLLEFFNSQFVVNGPGFRKGISCNETLDRTKILNSILYQFENNLIDTTKSKVSRQLLQRKD